MQARLIDELDVSGGTPLEKRAGLRAAVEAIEAGRAEVLVAASFDRLVRSLRVQDEVVSRVERAGGQVLALDTGAITNGTAGQWLSGTLLSAVAEDQRRMSMERSRSAQPRAIARGVVPWPNIPLGYRRRADGVLKPDPAWTRRSRRHILASVLSGPVAFEAVLTLAIDQTRPDHESAVSGSHAQAAEGADAVETWR